MSEPIKCKGCGAVLHAEAVSQLMDESRMSFTITPHPGERLSARNVGGSIADMDRLLSSIGRDMSVKTAVLVESISTNEAGAVTVKMIIARHEKGIKKRAKGKAAYDPAIHEEGQG